MTHIMNLWQGAFNSIANGGKTIELRLNDEKRQKIVAGDTIVFKSLSNNTIIAQVKALHKFKNFEELYNNLPLDKCGYEPEELSTAHYTDMNAYYSCEQIEKYGALGIELCNTEAICDVKSELLNEQIYTLLAPSVFNPTPQKLLSRAQKYFDTDNVYAYAFLQDGEYVGIVIFEIKDNVAKINDIAVNDEFRSNGIGSKLVKYIVDTFNVNVVSAETDDDAVGFYRKIGFDAHEIKTEYECKRYVCKLGK